MPLSTKEKSSSIYSLFFFSCNLKISIRLKHCGVCVIKKLFLFKFKIFFFSFFFNASFNFSIGIIILFFFELTIIFLINFFEKLGLAAS